MRRGSLPKNLIMNSFWLTAICVLSMCTFFHPTGADVICIVDFTENQLSLSNQNYGIIEVKIYTGDPDPFCQRVHSIKVDFLDRVSMSELGQCDLQYLLNSNYDFALKIYVHQKVDNVNEIPLRYYYERDAESVLTTTVELKPEFY